MKNALLLLTLLYLLHYSLTIPPGTATWQYLIQTEQSSTYNTGPKSLANLQLTTDYINPTSSTSAPWGMWTFFGYIYFDRSFASSLPSAQNIYAFNIESEKIGGGAVNLGFAMFTRPNNNVFGKFFYDGTNELACYRLGQNMASFTSKWWPVAVSFRNQSTVDKKYSFRFFLRFSNNINQGFGYEFHKVDNFGTENWDISKIKINIAAQSQTSTYMWNGKMAEYVFMGNYFEDTGRTYLEDLAGFQVQKPIYILDFTEPYTKQKLTNRAPFESYTSTIVGMHDHSDYKDFQFNPGKQSWTMRSYTHMLSFPTFKVGLHNRLNHTYNFNMKFININTQIGSKSASWDLFTRYTNGYVRRYGIYAEHTSNSLITLRAIYNGIVRTACSITCNDHDSDCTDFSYFDLYLSDMDVYTQATARVHCGGGSIIR